MDTNRKPDAWVTCGDIDYTADDYPPNWQMLTTSEAQKDYWVNECHLRVRPLYLGEPVNKS